MASDDIAGAWFPWLICNKVLASWYVLNAVQSASGISSYFWWLEQFFKLLGQRNEIVLKEQSQHLGVLTEQANRETGVMLDQSAKIGEDSKVMRILTTVAMIYLPATLVAVRAFFEIDFWANVVESVN
jgi:hypothetical protein